MMSGHKEPKTVMKYDHGRENMELNAANFLQYDEEYNGSLSKTQQTEKISHRDL